MTDAAIPESVRVVLRNIGAGDGNVVVLTGAGISAESGIPTFRGPEGYWTVGSSVYTLEEMATNAMFRRDPETVWRWYLHRFTVCRDARPNAAHDALVRLEQEFGNRFLLITQNIDGLHLTAGNSSQRTYQIHGQAVAIRCGAECSRTLTGFPDIAPRPDAEAALSEATRTALTCSRCGEWMRPHVLWFDEMYDEEYFRFESSQQAALDAALLLVIGTSGATTLPMRVGQLAASAGATVIDINPEDSPFSELAKVSLNGGVVRGPATEAVPAVVDELLHAVS